MILHYDDNIIYKLQTQLDKQHHFKTPLTSENYGKIFENVIKDYQKGYLPDDFKLDLAKIELCIKNNDNNNMKFSSDIVKILRTIIKKCNE